MGIHHFRRMTVVTSPRGKWWTQTFDEARFRITVGIVRSAGFEACYLTSPALMEYKGATRLGWDIANGDGGVYLDTHDYPEVDYSPVTDAIWRMGVPRHPPDRSSIDGGGFVSGSRVVVACDSRIDNAFRRAQNAEFDVATRLMREPSCASTQVFRATNANGVFNRRTFLAGLLLSIAIALLLETTATGVGPRGFGGEREEAFGADSSTG